MTKYDQLCNAFVSQQDDDRRYWDDLQLKAAHFTSGFSSFLELPKLSYQDMSGKAVNYIQLRNRRGKDEVHFLKLEGNAGAIEFDMAVTLEREEGMFPKTVITIPFSIGKAADSYAIWSDEASIAGRVDSSSSDYSDLYEQIFQKLQDHLNARPEFKVPH